MITPETPLCACGKHATLVRMENGKVASATCIKCADKERDLALPGWRTHPFEAYKPTPHDWLEDFSQENGNYENACGRCGARFRGHKRRLDCKACFVSKAASNLEKQSLMIFSLCNLIQSIQFHARAPSSWSMHIARDESLGKNVATMAQEWATEIAEYQAGTGEPKVIVDFYSGPLGVPFDPTARIYMHRDKHGALKQCRDEFQPAPTLEKPTAAEETAQDDKTQDSEESN